MFVSSRGILKACESHNEIPLSSSSNIDGSLLEKHRPGGAIYVCTHALSEFSTRFLPKLDAPFVLVTGDSDLPVNLTLLQEPRVNQILRSPLLLRWYAQNLDAKDPMISHLPIGLDYHTMWQNPGFWGLSSISPIAQERLLIETFSRSPIAGLRYLNAYCNWHFELERGDRRECYSEVEPAACFFEPRPVPRSATWVRQAECIFVLSPEGAGMDCHRTWEALCLGCVPIVKRNALQDLFKNLPVLIVDNWREVTRDRLKVYADKIATERFDFSSLFLNNWNKTIRNGESKRLPLMTMAEFRQTVTKVTG
jgi:hypothetical protein